MQLQQIQCLLKYLKLMNYLVNGLTLANRMLFLNPFKLISVVPLLAFPIGRVYYLGS